MRHARGARDDTTCLSLVGIRYVFSALPCCTHTEHTARPLPMCSVHAAVLSLGVLLYELITGQCGNQMVRAPMQQGLCTHAASTTFA